MDHISNISLVDAHAVRDCRTDDIELALLPGRLDDATLELRHARVIMMSSVPHIFEFIGQMVRAGLGVGLRHAIHNTALARAAPHEVDDGVADVLLRVVCVGGVRR